MSIQDINYMLCVAEHRRWRWYAGWLTNSDRKQHYSRVGRRPTTTRVLNNICTACPLALRSGTSYTGSLRGEGDTSNSVDGDISSNVDNDILLGRGISSNELSREIATDSLATATMCNNVFGTFTAQVDPRTSQQSFKQLHSFRTGLKEFFKTLTYFFCSIQMDLPWWSNLFNLESSVNGLHRKINLSGFIWRPWMNSYSWRF